MLLPRRIGEEDGPRKECPRMHVEKRKKPLKAIFPVAIINKVSSTSLKVQEFQFLCGIIPEMKKLQKLCIANQAETCL